MTLSDHLPCERCGYDLRASSEDCPECGHSVNRSRQAWERRTRGRRILLGTSGLSVLGYITVNLVILVFIYRGVIHPPWSAFNFTIFVLPVIGLIWASVLLIYAKYVVRVRLVAPWFVGTIFFLGTAIMINLMILGMAVASV